ncbi:hypothetical protein CC86DRAFT_370495 [Ophiobolus disseminans]|uniref:Ribonucleases P/MRP subunit Pop8-like domain-containing protein n=1 Tax=Ophiobolus disseminans TaxID=1469910 RepID=A0A6A6ZZU8_9PLEO|nr:hypothetical protein CC86DRAFT_370495 [Ophiobolus disseminans]
MAHTLFLNPTAVAELASTSEYAQQAPAPPSQTRPAQKRKRKDKDASQTHNLQQTTFRRAAWSYFHLTLVTPQTASLPSLSTAATIAESSLSSPNDISPITTFSLLRPPLQSFLGITGVAIPIDTLKTCGRDVWIRVPRQDARAFRAALSGWVGSADREYVTGSATVDSSVKVRVAWRIQGEGGTVLSTGGGGGEMFGG